MAHNWEQWLHHPWFLGGPQCPPQGENQKWPTSGPTSPLPSQGSPMPSKGRKPEIAHMWAQWLHHPCLVGVYHRQQAKSNSGRQTSRGSDSRATQHTPCPVLDLPNPLSGLDPSLPSMLDTDAKRTAAATSKVGHRPP